jgi:small conductance mechanosensitive channel
MSKIWQDIVDFFVVNGWKIVGVVAMVLIGALAIRIICRGLRRLFIRRKVDAIVSSFITSIVNIGLIVILIVAVFDILGISTAPFVAVLGTAGLALALSLQDSLSNVASGVVLIITKPFKKGDYVSISGVEGSVEALNMLTTRLLTFDNKYIMLSNSKVAKSDIINYSMMDTRRVDLTFNVAYGSDVDKVKTAIYKTALAQGMMLEEPAPIIRLYKHSDSSLEIVAKIWVKTFDYWTVYYDMQEKVYETFRAEGIEIPFNQLDVHVKEELKNEK